MNGLKHTSYFPPQRFYLRSMSPFKGQDQPSKCRKMPCMDWTQSEFDSIWLETSCIGLSVHLIHAFHTHCFSIELSIFKNLRSISTCKGQRSNLWKYLVWTGNELHLIKVS